MTRDDFLPGDLVKMGITWFTQDAWGLGLVLETALENSRVVCYRVLWPARGQIILHGTGYGYDTHPDLFTSKPIQKVSP